MDRLGQDTSMAVLGFLDLQSIYHLSIVSKRLYEFWSDSVLWHILLTRHTVPELQLIIDPAFSIKKLSHLKPTLWTNLRVPDPRVFYKNIAKGFRMVRTLPLDAVGESSHDFDQDINRTLSLNPDTFWSSIGSASRTSNEFLRYELSAPAFVFWVGVRLFRAGYQGGVVYPPAQFQVKIGLEKDQWDYTSTAVDALSTGSEQVLLVLPGLILGRFLQLELLGKQQTQVSDNLFYVAIESVKCSGVPLALCTDLKDLNLSIAVPVAQIEELISAENYADWSKKFAEKPDLVLRECLEEINETGKLWEYFAEVQKSRPLNKYEAYYYLEHVPASTEPKDIPFSSFTLSEDIGDLLFSKGQLRIALNVYARMQVAPKTVKCLLKLKLFRECAHYLTSRQFGMPDMPEVLAIASSLGEDVAREYQAFLQQAEQAEEEGEEEEEDPRDEEID